MNRPRAAVVGDPIAHSLSPELFAEFSEAMGRPLHYRRLRLLSVDLDAVLGNVREASPPWIGWSVTIPHKVSILSRLDDLAASAKEAGAVNVIHFKDGRAIGHNTDGEGFLASLEAAKALPRGKKILLLGAGGAARGIGCAMRGAGAGEITVLNRTEEKAKKLAKELGGRGGRLCDSAVLEAAADADLIVNATSLGMGGSGSPVPERVKFRKEAVACDLVYRPALTPFLKAARRGGARTIGGFGMLVAQAAAAWSIWFGEGVPRAVLDSIRSDFEGRSS